MRGTWQILMLMAVILAVSAALYAVDPTPEEIQENRAKLNRWREADRNNGDHKNYRRLRHALGEFLALPRERREQLRRLDHELYQTDPSTQAHLLNVMERYVDWMERLPHEERTQVKKASTPEQRLVMIREIRERQWIAHLPATDRDQLNQAQGKKRAHLMARLRQRDRQRRTEWARAFRRWDELLKRKPLTLENSPEELKIFVDQFLRPRLNEDEAKRLNVAAKNRFLFPITLVELADQHPMALPGPNGPTRFEELPKTIQDLLPELKEQMKDVEGKWPEYGKAVGARLRSKKNKVAFPVEFMPAGIEDLSPAMKRFVRQKLRKALTQPEKARLRKAKGWPVYPQLIDELARKHKLRPPWQSLPGPQARWDVYRDKPLVPRKTLPAVPRRILKEFALLELTKKERDRLGLTPADARSWERLKEVYFDRKKNELKHWREIEKKKKPAKGNKGNKK